jgi:rRNA large subunit m3Psi methyltransferase RlmH
MRIWRGHCPPALTWSRSSPVARPGRRFLSERMVHGTRAVVFLIGGADGLPPAVVAGASRRLSLSPLTLPHRLARVILCEQLYRCISAIRGEPYNR